MGTKKHIVKDIYEKDFDKGSGFFLANFILVGVPSAIAGCGALSSVLYKSGAYTVGAALTTLSGFAIFVPAVVVMGGMYATSSYATRCGERQFLNLDDAFFEVEGDPDLVYLKSRQDMNSAFKDMADRNIMLALVPEPFTVAHIFGAPQKREYLIFYKVSDNQQLQWRVPQGSELGSIIEHPGERSAFELRKLLITSKDSAVRNYYGQQSNLRSKKYALLSSILVAAAAITVLVLTACPFTMACGIFSACLLAAYVAGGVYGAKTYKIKTPSRSKEGLFARKGASNLQKHLEVGDTPQVTF